MISMWISKYLTTPQYISFYFLETFTSDISIYIYMADIQGVSEMMH